jgi:hypothetical protein
MNARTGKIEFNRDHYEYCENFIAELRNAADLDKDLVGDILRDYYYMKNMVASGMAVFI